MKKILSLLLCAAMLLGLLAGCSDNGDGTTAPAPTEHKHTYESNWSYDETNHWYNATCEHTALKANYGEHLDENLDGNCDLCGWFDETHEHEYSEEWTTDETNHWHAASCTHIGSISEQAAHIDEDNDGLCDVCAYSGGHEHTYVEDWTYDATNHWHEASCGHSVVGSQAAHEDVNNDGICDVCGWFDETHTHTFADTWKTDAVYHWHGATCEHLGAVSEKNEHADGDENGYCDTCNYLMCKHSDFDLDGECDTCGYEDPNHVHEYSAQLGSNASGHWAISTCHPGSTTAIETHVDANNDGSCDACAWVICGHTFSEAWTSNETHHWKAILCTCSIPRKDYALHEDHDGDGGCDICMYGKPIEAVYEVIVDMEPVEFIQTGMITYQEFVVNFPQPGRYIITPNNAEVRTWRLDVEDFNNTESSLTVEVEEAGEMTFHWQYFTFNYNPDDAVFYFGYSVVRVDNLVMETMQGKVELPTNTIYKALFTAPESGTYNLITTTESLEIGLTEDSMEYYKGHIKFTVEKGDTINLYLRVRTELAVSFIFDWYLEEPFSLPVSTGTYNIDVAPKRIDYKIDFTAPEDGYYRLAVASEWLTFCEWVEELKQPRRLEVTEILTGHMKAGETFTTWLQTVYNYPDVNNCYDILTVENVGIKLGMGTSTQTPGAEGSRYCFQASDTSYYRLSVTGGELGVIGPNGTISWTTDPYEVRVDIYKTYSFMLRGENVSVNIQAVNYSVNLQEGDNNLTLVPNKHYTLNTGTGGINANNSIALTWEGNMSVYVDGVEVTQGSTIELLGVTVTFLAKGSTDVNVTVNMIYVYESGAEIPGETDAALIVGTETLMAVHKAGPGTGAKATFTADFGGTYAIECSSENGTISVVDATGIKDLKVSGLGTYTFELEAGESIEFYIDTVNGAQDTISITVKAET